jgi:hypothetical protein
MCRHPIRYEWRDDIHYGFLQLGCSRILFLTLMLWF